MRILKIQGDNFKLGPTDVDLSPVHLFTGPTGCGKTTVLDLARLALEAKVMDSQYSRIDLIHRDFATNGDLIKAVIKMDTEGVALARFIGKDKKGKVGQQVNFLGEKLGKVAAEKKIAEIFNPCAEALDFGLFRAKSAIERQAYLLGLCEDPEGWDRSKIWTACSKVTAGHGDLESVVLDELFEVWLGDGVPARVTDGVLKLKEKVQVMKNDANATSRKKAVVEEELLSYVDEDAGTVDVDKAEKVLSGDITHVSRKLDAKRKREKELIALISKEREKAQEHTRWANSKALNDGEIKKAKDDLERVEKGGRNFEVEVKHLTEKVHGDHIMDQLRQELADLEGKLPDLQSEKQETKRTYIAARNKAEASQRLAGFVDEDVRICPVAVELQKECPVDWDKDETEAAYINASAEAERLEGKAAEAKALRDECREKIDETTKTIQRYETDNIKVNSDIALVNQQEISHLEAVKMKDQAIADALLRHHNHLKAEPHAKGVADVEKAEQELTGVKTTITAFSADFNTKNQEMGRKLAVLKAERERLEIGLRLEYVKMLAEAVHELVEEMLAEALEDVIGLINGCLPDGWSPRIEQENGDFFVGAYIPDAKKYIPLNSMSAGQQAIFATAVRIALMNASGSKLKVLLCEMDTLDFSYTEQVLDIAVQAVEAGHLDNFIGCTNKDILEIVGVEITRIKGVG